MNQATQPKTSSLLPLGVGLLLLVLIGLFLREPDTTTPESPAQPDNRTFNPSPVDSKPNNIRDQVRTSRQGKAERDQRIRENPEAFFDPDRNDRAYLAKVRRHNQIGQFLSSSRRDDRSYRRILSLLLENGYGIEEWAEAVSILGFHHLPVVLQRQSLIEAGFSPQQIEDELGSARHQQNQQLRMIHENLRARCAIDDPELVRQLLAIEIEFLPNEDVLGLAPLRTIRGDKLFTDDDWLEPEFAKAQARYKGPPRQRHDTVQVDAPLAPPRPTAQSGPLPVVNHPPQ